MRPVHVDNVEAAAATRWTASLQYMHVCNLSQYVYFLLVLYICFHDSACIYVKGLPRESERPEPPSVDADGDVRSPVTVSGHGVEAAVTEGCVDADGDVRSPVTVSGHGVERQGRG